MDADRVVTTEPRRFREPTGRELRQFRRGWLRNFGPARNDRNDQPRRWLKLGWHRMDMREWSACYAAYVDHRLETAVTVALTLDGRAVAWACYEPPKPAEPDAPVRLYFVYVDPKHRGNGIGRELHDRIARGRPVTYLHMTRREDG